MAKQMQFKDIFGNTNPTSYWRVVQVNVSVPDKSALVMFYGYKDADARKGGKQPVGAKQYSIMGETFDAMYAEHLKDGGPNLAAMAYKYATECKDVMNTDKTAVSFFADAKDV